MRRKIFHAISVFAPIVAALALLASPASAMKVEPLLLDLSTLDKNARQSFKVTNDGTKPLPVEISTFRLELNGNKEQITGPDEDSLLIYPAQKMIAPGASQVFRVQWIGEPDLAQSQSYRLSVEQVPVKLPEGTSGIQIVMNFGITVNVAPPSGSSDIVVLGAEPVMNKDGKRVAALRVKNPGNIHAYLQRSIIRLSGSGWSAEMTPGQISQTLGLGILQPGKERRFILPVEVPASVSSIAASVERQSGAR